MAKKLTPPDTHPDQLYLPGFEPLAVPTPTPVPSTPKPKEDPAVRKARLAAAAKKRKFDRAMAVQHAYENRQLYMDLAYSQENKAREAEAQARLERMVAAGEATVPCRVDIVYLTADIPPVRLTTDKRILEAGGEWRVVMKPRDPKPVNVIEIVLTL